MSLILDALKRAERERKAELGPVLGDLPAPRTSLSATRPPWKLVVAAILLGLVGFFGWQWSRKPRGTEPVVVQAPAPKPIPPAASPTTPPAQTPIIASAPPPQVIHGTESVASLDEITEGEPEPRPVSPPKPVAQQSKPTALAKAAAPSSATQATPAPRVSAEAQPAPAPVAETPAQSQPAAAPEPKPTRAAPENVPPTLTQPAQYRKFREMPPEYRADFPLLTVEVHVYQQIAQQRFVIVNGRRYRQGETLAEGPQIVEIVPEGIVLDYRGERLLYTIGH